MRLLLVLLLTVCSLAPVPVRADVGSSDTESQRSMIGANLAHLDQHARGSERIGRRSAGASAAGEGMPRASATSPTGSRIAIRWALLTLARGARHERSFRVASRGEHVPYFPIAPPVQG